MTIPCKTVYINFQFIRGFFNENMITWLPRLSGGFSNDAVAIGPPGLTLEAANLNCLKESWAAVFNPQLTRYPADGAEINLVRRWIEGKTGTSLAKQREKKSLCFKARYSF